MTNNMSALSLETVKMHAPAAFALAPSARMSGVYSHVTTATVLEALMQDGWSIASAQQTKSRIVGAAEHNAHRISLTHPSLPEHAEGLAQMHLGNSGNGTSAVRLMGGFLRMACLNQNFVGVKVVGGVINHRGGSLQDRVVAMARDLRGNFDRVIRKFDLWSQIEMSPEAQRTFAAQALALRWTRELDRPVLSVEAVLDARRVEDDKPTLWHTYNRVQESLIRGGFRAQFASVDAEGNRLNTLTTRTVRKVTGLNANERINTGLWELAETVAG